MGWSATFALLTYFVTFGGWGREADGSAPLPSFVILCAVLGFFVHFVTSLPDLVEDNKAGMRHLPLRVALKTGAPRLMVVSLVATVVVVAALVYKALERRNRLLSDRLALASRSSVTPFVTRAPERSLRDVPRGTASPC